MAGTHIALLRGINVGKAKRIAMADLRALLESLGYEDVRTLLNSGNIVFTVRRAAADPAPRIEGAILKQLGVSTRVTVLPARELAEALAANPLRNVADDPARMLVTVLRKPTDRTRLAALAKEDWSPEGFAVGRRVAYLWCAGGIIESRILKAVERLLGQDSTSRNWTTMMKLHALCSGGG
jgi:uncharacterized protein (DUF1697 family)